MCLTRNSKNRLADLEPVMQSSSTKNYGNSTLYSSFGASNIIGFFRKGGTLNPYSSFTIKEKHSEENDTNLFNSANEEDEIYNDYSRDHFFTS
jgi:hypothetical protein